MKTRGCNHCTQQVFLSVTPSEVPGFQLFDPDPISGWQRVFGETDVSMVPAVVYAEHGCGGYLQQREGAREKWLLEEAASVRLTRGECESARRRKFERRITIAQDIAAITGTDDWWTTMPAIEDIAYEIVCDKCEANKDDRCWNLAATRNKSTTAHPHPDRIYAALAAREIKAYLHTNGRVQLYPIADPPPESTEENP